MEFGLFLEFTSPEGTTDQEFFSQGFSLVDRAESMGVESVWVDFGIARGPFPRQLEEPAGVADD